MSAANLRAADAEGVSGRILNTPQASPTTVNELAETISGLLGKTPGKTHQGARLGDLRDRGPTPTEARDALGWEATGLEDGVRPTSPEPLPPPEPVRVLRVIARLNKGGPALHVAYLSAGLRGARPQTTLVAGSLARGEGSDGVHVAEQAGVEVVLSRPIYTARSAAPRPSAAHRLAGLIKHHRPHPPHAHSEGRRRRAHRRVVRGRRTTAHRRAHVPRPRPPRLLRRGLQRSSHAGAQPRLDDHGLAAVEFEVRDDLVALGVAPEEKFTVIRLGVELAERVDLSPETRPARAG